jgi:UDP-N-acetylmuramate dehydrogenase
MLPDKTDFSERFEKVIGRPPERFVPLKEYAHFKIGGKADYFFSASSLSVFVRVVNFVKKSGFPYCVIGGGYNLLFDDEGFQGLIVKNQVRGIKKKSERKMEVLSGTPLSDLLQFCVRNAWKGFEFLAGIPGTVGGAVCGNAGAFDQAIGSFLTEALILGEDGEQIEVDGDYFGFDYRRSRLRSNRELLLKAVFSLEPGTQEEIAAKIDENLEKRKSKHPPWNVACAGSYFKNPVLPDGKRIPAAYLLDKVGAKGLAVGGAAVFSNHANFIINLKDATARDVLGLARELKDRVKNTFGVELEEEVIFLPANPSRQ